MEITLSMLCDATYLWRHTQQHLEEHQGQINQLNVAAHQKILEACHTSTSANDNGGCAWCVTRRGVAADDGSQVRLVCSSEVHEPVCRLCNTTRGVDGMHALLTCTLKSAGPDSMATRCGAKPTISSRSQCL